jgi:hypothetical protein
MAEDFPTWKAGSFRFWKYQVMRPDGHFKAGRVYTSQQSDSSSRKIRDTAIQGLFEAHI